MADKKVLAILKIKSMPGVRKQNSEDSDLPFKKVNPGKIVEDLDELIGEHEQLVKTLDSPSHADDKQESKKQAKELKKYKEKRNG